MDRCMNDLTRPLRVSSKLPMWPIVESAMSVLKAKALRQCNTHPLWRQLCCLGCRPQI